MPGRQFWIGVVSRAHVQIGVSGGFGQLKVPAQDFNIIAEAMGLDFALDFGE